MKMRSGMVARAGTKETERKKERVKEADQTLEGNGPSPPNLVAFKPPHGNYCESNSRKQAKSYSLSSEVGEVEADEIPELDSLILRNLCVLEVAFALLLGPTFSES